MAGLQSSKAENTQQQVNGQTGNETVPGPKPNEILLSKEKEWLQQHDGCVSGTCSCQEAR